MWTLTDSFDSIFCVVVLLYDMYAVRVIKNSRGDDIKDCKGRDWIGRGLKSANASGGRDELKRTSNSHAILIHSHTHTHARRHTHTYTHTHTHNRTQTRTRTHLKLHVELLVGGQLVVEALLALSIHLKYLHMFRVRQL
jgi:hypothetical protein